MCNFRSSNNSACCAAFVSRWCCVQVAALPLATYEIKYDSVKGRRHLGPVGPGLQEAIPESVEVHARSTYPSKKVYHRLMILFDEFELHRCVLCRYSALVRTLVLQGTTRLLYVLLPGILLLLLYAILNVLLPSLEINTCYTSKQ